MMMGSLLSKSLRLAPYFAISSSEHIPLWRKVSVYFSDKYERNASHKILISKLTFFSYVSLSPCLISGMILFISKLSMSVRLEKFLNFSTISFTVAGIVSYLTSWSWNFVSLGKFIFLSFLKVNESLSDLFQVVTGAHIQAKSHPHDDESCTSPGC